jgi:osmoprotectant transport system ATP-binding protein
VGDLALRPAVTARAGESAAAARERARADPFPYLLLVDAQDRPVGWISDGRIPASGALEADQATPMSPLLDRFTTLKDALSMMLDADVQAGIVVDRAGRVEGLITIEAIADVLRGERDAEREGSARG